MSWATSAINELKSGHEVKIRPRGGSMSGKIESGQLVTIRPIKHIDQLAVNDIVLCTVNGSDYLHFIKEIEFRGTINRKFLIGNNRGGINGWITPSKIYGIVSKIED